MIWLIIIIGAAVLLLYKPEVKAESVLGVDSPIIPASEFQEQLDPGTPPGAPPYAPPVNQRAQNVDESVLGAHTAPTLRVGHAGTAKKGESLFRRTLSY